LDLAEDRVLAVEPWRGHEREEELAAVRSRTGVRHAQQPRAVVLHAGGELAVEAVAGAAGAAAERTAALRHELRDDAVERQAVVEAQSGQVRKARHVHGRGLGQELDRQLALGRDHARAHPRAGGEREHLRLGQPRAPAGLRRIDLGLGDELLEHLHGDLRCQAIRARGCPRFQRILKPRMMIRNTDASAAAAGMVMTQAHTIRDATPHFTAESRREAETPEPTIAPVMVCVVETGTPSALAPNSAIAPAVSAQNPPTGWSRVMRMPMVSTMRQPPESVPSPIAP